MATISARAISLVAASACLTSSWTAARTRTFVSTVILTSCLSFLTHRYLSRPAASRSVIHLFDGRYLFRLPRKHAKEVLDLSRWTRRPDHAPSIRQQIQRDLFAGLYTE